MAKVSGRSALRSSDIAARIDVVRDGATSTKKHLHATHASHDGDARIMHEVSEDLRVALVPDRIAEAVARQLEPAVDERVRVLLQQQLSQELRTVLRKHARNGFAEIDPSDILSDALADALTSGASDVLSEQFSSALRERLPVAIRAATARSAFAHRVGAAGIEDLGDRVSAVAEGTIRQRVTASIRSAVRSRIGEVVRDDVRDLLRTTATDESAGAVSGRIASIADGIERATRDRVVRGIVERFRALVASSLHHATGERLGDGLQRTLAAAPRAPRPPKSNGNDPRDREAHDGLAERLEGPVAEAIRSRLMDGLRERVEQTCRENIDDVLRERLLGATRVAIAEQRGADAVDGGRLAEVISYELAEVLRARICDGIRARTAEAVRTRLADAVRVGIARSHAV